MSDVAREIHAPTAASAPFAIPPCSSHRDIPDLSRQRRERAAARLKPSAETCCRFTSAIPRCARDRSWPTRGRRVIHVKRCAPSIAITAPSLRGCYRRPWLGRNTSTNVAYITYRRKLGRRAVAGSLHRLTVRCRCQRSTCNTRCDVPPSPAPRHGRSPTRRGLRIRYRSPVLPHPLMEIDKACLLFSGCNQGFHGKPVNVTRDPLKGARRASRAAVVWASVPVLAGIHATSPTWTTPSLWRESHRIALLSRPGGSRSAQRVREFHGKPPGRDGGPKGLCPIGREAMSAKTVGHTRERESPRGCSTWHPQQVPRYQDMAWTLRALTVSDAWGAVARTVPRGTLALLPSTPTVLRSTEQQTSPGIPRQSTWSTRAPSTARASPSQQMPNNQRPTSPHSAVHEPR